MQVTTEEKKAWAEDLLQKKYTELGRLPTKRTLTVLLAPRSKLILVPGPGHWSLPG